MFSQILKGTPYWVFVLFFALVALGYFQSRDRTVSRGRVAIVPVAFIALSVYGVLSAFGGAAVGPISWLLGIGVAVWLGVKFTSSRGVSYSAETRSFSVAGSWIPMILMMAIFITKYAVGVGQALQIEILSEPTVIGAISGWYGILSGLFFARAIVVWRTAGRVAGATA